MKIQLPEGNRYWICNICLRESAYENYCELESYTIWDKIAVGLATLSDFLLYILFT